LFETVSKLRAWDLNLLINRFYVLKKDGVRWRPIGAPDWPSRIISKALMDIIYALSESDRTTGQHGYIKNRGTWSAVEATVRKLEQGYSVLEFDLTSFFNTVEPFIIFKKLEKYGREVTYLTSSILKRITYRWDELKEEAELRRKGTKSGLELIERRGTPQGLSLSPLLATWALEYFGRPEDLEMYADDGLFFYKNHSNPFWLWIDRMGKAGIRLNTKKTREIRKGETFTFLGVIIDTKNKTLQVGQSKIYWADKDRIKWLQQVAQWYGKESVNWEWKIHKEAFMRFRRTDEINIQTKLIIYYKGIVWAKSHKGYRWFWFQKGIHDILSTSSHSCNEMIKVMSYKSSLIGKIKGFNGDDKIALDHMPLKKGRYKRYLHRNTPATKKAQRYWEIVNWTNNDRLRWGPTLR
jgi:hypothetical protein